MFLPSLFKLRPAVAFVVLLLTGLAAWAAPASALITHNYEGTCDFGCAEIGLTQGDSVFATFDFHDSSVSAGAVLGRADVASFALDFGFVEFTSATASGRLLTSPWRKV